MPIFPHDKKRNLSYMSHNTRQAILTALINTHDHRKTKNKSIAYQQQAKNRAQTTTGGFLYCLNSAQLLTSVLFLGEMIS